MRTDRSQDPIYDPTGKVDMSQMTAAATAAALAAPSYPAQCPSCGGDHTIQFSYRPYLPLTQVGVCTVCQKEVA